jgi:hypothetical protein
MLKLKQGWQTHKTDRCAYLYAPGEDVTGINWYVDIDKNGVCAYPHAGPDSVCFDTIEKAHEYLLSVGSESPWEEITENNSRPESPDYYTRGGLDCADIVNAYALDYWIGSAVVHLLRAGCKPGETRLDALENALACLRHAIVAERNKND